MLQQVLEFIHQKNWGDAASVLGVAISVTGFGFTLVGLARSKSAAKQVAAAVADVREKLALKNLAAEVSKLMSDIEEVKALHRIGA